MLGFFKDISVCPLCSSAFHSFFFCSDSLIASIVPGNHHFHRIIVVKASSCWPTKTSPLQQLIRNGQDTNLFTLWKLYYYKQIAEADNNCWQSASQFCLLPILGVLTCLLRWWHYTQLITWEHWLSFLYAKLCSLYSMHVQGPHSLKTHLRAATGLFYSCIRLLPYIFSFLQWWKVLQRYISHRD